MSDRIYPTRDRKLVPKASGRQTRLMSLLEAFLNTLIGLVIAYAATWLIVWAYDMSMSNLQMFQMVSWMTVLSVVRGYVLRRAFNSEFWKRWKFRTRLPVAKDVGDK